MYTTTFLNIPTYLILSAAALSAAVPQRFAPSLRARHELDDGNGASPKTVTVFAPTPVVTVTVIPSSSKPASDSSRVRVTTQVVTVTVTPSSGMAQSSGSSSVRVSSGQSSSNAQRSGPSSVRMSSTQSISSKVSSASSTPTPSAITLSSITTIRPPPVTATSTFSVPRRTTSPTPFSLASQTASSSPSSATASAPTRSEDPEKLKEIQQGSDKVLILVVALVVSVLLILGLAISFYRGFYLPRKEKRKQAMWKGMKPLRLQPGPTPGTPRAMV
ncbi:hypothetical protein HYALB_00011171 [Hymenoscyphus albidus]|uniref:Mid2 domain-containing protein n=1 Tax=Hymenoscyphus albidus TaxID=595503 RepID=A0A9N9Q523_9HELO|nr:hypothetical protein HYALB_00011171 [Hymenoscyphus albidus]